MIDYSKMVVTSGVGGDSKVQTLSGSITLEEGTGQMVIRDPIDNVPVQIHDFTGTYYFNTDGTELVSVTPQRGFLFNDGNNRRILLGRYASRVGLWISKNNQDVIDLLGG